jgi:hypothetical protein
MIYKVETLSWLYWEQSVGSLHMFIFVSFFYKTDFKFSSLKQSFSVCNFVHGLFAIWKTLKQSFLTSNSMSFFKKNFEKNFSFSFWLHFLPHRILFCNGLLCLRRHDHSTIHFYHKNICENQKTSVVTILWVWNFS